jgi:hypothetical protein
MLYVKGKVWVNGKDTPDSSTVFSGDVVQTDCDSMANINVPGSNLNVQYDSTVKFESGAISLQYGILSLATSKRVTVKAGNVVATPVSEGQTEFEVYNLDPDDLNVIARVGDLSVNVGGKLMTLHPGQQSNPSADNKREKKPCHAPGYWPGVRGGLLGSPTAMWLGAGAVGGVTIYLLTRDPKPISPDHP